MQYYAVIDTNVVVSSMLKHDSIPGKIIDLVMMGVIKPLINNEILVEYKEVLTRNKFGLSISDVDDLLNEITRTGIVLTREKTIEKFIDENDIVFYEIVMSARNVTNAYLITGNLKHYPVKSYVVTPKEMIDIIYNNN